MVLNIEGIEIVETAGKHGASAGGAVTVRLQVHCKKNKSYKFIRNIYIFVLHTVSFIQDIILNHTVNVLNRQEEQETRCIYIGININMN